MDIISETLDATTAKIQAINDSPEKNQDSNKQTNIKFKLFFIKSKTSSSKQPRQVWNCTRLARNR